jgi:hypothetical protein
MDLLAGGRWFSQPEGVRTRTFKATSHLRDAAFSLTCGAGIVVPLVARQGQHAIKAKTYVLSTISLYLDVHQSDWHRGLAVIVVQTG